MRVRYLLPTLVAAALLATHGARAAPGNGLPDQVEALTKEVAMLVDTLNEMSATAEHGTPVQLHLTGLFSEGSINLGPSVLGPMSFTAPDGKSLLVEFATCQAVRELNDLHQFDITLEADFIFTGTTTPQPLVQFVPTSIWESPGPFGDRTVASTATHAYLNIPSPAAGAPAIGNVLRLRAQRNGTTGGGGVNCTITGKLFPRPLSQ